MYYDYVHQFLDQIYYISTKIDKYSLILNLYTHCTQITDA